MKWSAVKKKLTELFRDGLFPFTLWIRWIFILSGSLVGVVWACKELDILFFWFLIPVVLPFLFLGLKYILQPDLKANLGDRSPKNVEKFSKIIRNQAPRNKILSLLFIELFENVKLLNDPKITDKEIEKFRLSIEVKKLQMEMLDCFAKESERNNISMKDLTT